MSVTTSDSLTGDESLLKGVAELTEGPVPSCHTNIACDLCFLHTFKSNYRTALYLPFFLWQLFPSHVFFLLTPTLRCSHTVSFPSLQSPSSSGPARLTQISPPSLVRSHSFASVPFPPPPPSIITSLLLFLWPRSM